MHRRYALATRVAGVFALFALSTEHGQTLPGYQACDAHRLEKALQESGWMSASADARTFQPLELLGSLSETVPSAGDDPRLNLDGVRARRGVPTPAPGVSVVSGRCRHHSFSAPPGPSPCQEVRMNSTCGAFELLPTAYLGTIQPNSLRRNDLGDPGATDENSLFAFHAPGGSTIRLVVDNRHTSATPCRYRLNVNVAQPIHETSNVNQVFPCTLDPSRSFAAAQHLIANGRSTPQCGCATSIRIRRRVGRGVRPAPSDRRLRRRWCRGPGQSV